MTICINSGTAFAWAVAKDEIGAWGSILSFLDSGGSRISRLTKWKVSEDEWRVGRKTCRSERVYLDNIRVGGFVNTVGRNFHHSGSSRGRPPVLYSTGNGLWPSSFLTLISFEWQPICTNGKERFGTVHPWKRESYIVESWMIVLAQCGSTKIIT